MDILFSAFEQVLRVHAGFDTSEPVTANSAFSCPAMDFVDVLSQMTGATSDLLATLRAVSWLPTKQFRPFSYAAMDCIYVLFKGAGTASN
jgi:hypothetical protein